MIDKAKPGDFDYVSPVDGGCWFCNRSGGEDFDFDVEFDTNVHLGCIREVLKENPNHPEARWMRYLLPEYDGKD